MDKLIKEEFFKEFLIDEDYFLSTGLDWNKLAGLRAMRTTARPSRPDLRATAAPSPRSSPAISGVRRG